MMRISGRAFAHSLCPPARNELALIAGFMVSLAILLPFRDPNHVQVPGSRRSTHSRYPAGGCPHLQPGARQENRAVTRPLLAPAATARRGRLYLGLRHTSEWLGHWAPHPGLRSRDAGEPSPRDGTAVRPPHPGSPRGVGMPLHEWRERLSATHR